MVIYITTAEECDARDDATCNAAGNIKKVEPGSTFIYYILYTRLIQQPHLNRFLHLF